MKKLILILIFCSLFFTECYSQSGWQWLNPLPQGNRLNTSIFVNSQTGFSFGDCGAFIKSINGGLNWFVIPLNVGSDIQGVSFINELTGTVVGTNGIILRTTNGGNNWINQTFNDSINFNAVSFLNPDTGFAVTSYWHNGRIYKTTNGGLNWSMKYMVNWITLHSVIAQSQNKIFVAGVNKFLKSTDCGETWFQQNVQSADSAEFFSLNFLNPATGFVAGSNSSLYLYKTIDSGNTWNRHLISLNNYDYVNSVIFINAQNGLIAGRNMQTTKAIIYLSTDGGNYWNKQSMPDSSKELVSISRVSANNVIITGNFGIILNSTNSGSSFTKISKSFTDEILTWASFINNQTGIVCGFNGAIFRTNNGGVTWTQQNCPGAQNIIKAKLLDNDTGIAVANNGKVYKTTNGGNVWNVLLNDTVNANWATADFIDSKYITITGGHCAHAAAYTTNGGVNWTFSYIDCNCSPPLPTGCDSRNLLVIADSKHQILAGVLQGSHEPGPSYVKTTYDGVNWNNLFYSGPGEVLGALVGYADTSNALLSIYYLGKGKIYRTFNGFRNIIYYPFPDPNLSSGDVSLADSLNGLSYITQLFSYNDYELTGIYKTTNGGQNWYPTGFVSNNISYLDYYKFNFAVAWGSYGCLVSNQNPGILSVSNLENSLPVNFKLYQNYPNPFNPTTIIKYSIPRLSSPHALSGDPVLLKVYDILGKEIATLVNEKRNPGTYEVTFDGSKLSSGIYFYTLSTGVFKETKKMIILK